MTWALIRKIQSLIGQLQHAVSETKQKMYKLGCYFFFTKMTYKRNIKIYSQKYLWGGAELYLTEIKTWNLIWKKKKKKKKKDMVTPSALTRIWAASRRTVTSALNNRSFEILKDWEFMVANRMSIVWCKPYYKTNIN